MFCILLIFGSGNSTVFSQELNLEIADSIRIQVLKSRIYTPFAVDMSNFSQFAHQLKVDTTIYKIAGSFKWLEKSSLYFEVRKKKESEIRALIIIYTDGFERKIGVTRSGYFIDENGKYCKKKKLARKIFDYGKWDNDS